MNLYRYFLYATIFITDLFLFYVFECLKLIALNAFARKLYNNL